MEEKAEGINKGVRKRDIEIDAVNRLFQFFAKIMIEPIDTTYGILGDTLKYNQWERQTKLVEKAEHLIKEKNLLKILSPIPAKLVLPIFQNASLENDDFLHDFYAKLMVSAMDPKFRTRRTAFVEILRQLEPLDVKILQTMYSVYIEKEKRFKDRYGKEKFFILNISPTWIPINKGEVLDSLSVNDKGYLEAFDNLCRLKLADSCSEKNNTDLDTDDKNRSEAGLTSHGGNEICLTTLGLSFVKICNY
jgi:hypothetical protein